MANKRVTETQILKNDVVKAYAKINEDIQNLQKQIDTLREEVPHGQIETLRKWVVSHLSHHDRLEEKIDTLNTKIELINHQEVLTERLEKNA